MVKEGNGVFRNHPTLIQDWNFREKAADRLAYGMGSWTFLIVFFVILLAWTLGNAYFLIKYQLGDPFDPYPFIFLNLILSCLAAIQAPIILMSQNRAAQKDRIRSEYDYAVNRKAEREIEEIKNQLERIERKLKK